MKLILHRHSWLSIWKTSFSSETLLPHIPCRHLKHILESERPILIFRNNLSYIGGNLSYIVITDFQYEKHNFLLKICCQTSPVGIWSAFWSLKDRFWFSNKCILFCITYLTFPRQINFLKKNDPTDFNLIMEHLHTEKE